MINNRVGVVAVCLSLYCSPVLNAADWPQWRGPHRDGKSADTGLLKQWPAGGPQLVWKANGAGKSYSGIAAVGDRLYTMGDEASGSSVVALKADGGAVAWTTKIGKSGAPGGFAGPRCTPTIDGDLLFAVDQWGDLVCLDLKDGKERWRKEYANDFGGGQPGWGYAESPLVDGDRVVVFPGSQKGSMVALNKRDGSVLWQSKDYKDGAQYSSIVPAEIAGVPQYVQLTMGSVAGVAAKDGALLWKATRRGSTAVIPTPIVDGDLVYVTSGYGIGCNLFKVTGSDGKLSAQQVYANKVMVNHHGGVIKVGDYVYGYSDGKGFTCQDFKSGEAKWAERDKVKKCSVSFADGMFYCREEDSGTVILVAASPDGFSEKGRLKQPNRTGDHAWAHPTIANGRLYLRDDDTVFCYDVKGRM